MLRVLVADGLIQRANSFRMRPGSANRPAYLFRIVRTPELLAAALHEQQWDVLLHSLYFNTKELTDASLGGIVHAHTIGHLRGVVITSISTPRAEKAVRWLRKWGVPTIYVPYRDSNPSDHTVVAIPDAPLVPRALQEAGR